MLTGRKTLYISAFRPINTEPCGVDHGGGVVGAGVEDDYHLEFGRVDLDLGGERGEAAADPLLLIVGGDDDHRPYLGPRRGQRRGGADRRRAVHGARQQSSR